MCELTPITHALYAQMAILYRAAGRFELANIYNDFGVHGIGHIPRGQQWGGADEKPVSLDVAMTVLGNMYEVALMRGITR